MKIGSTTPHFLIKSGVQLRIFNAKLETISLTTKNNHWFLIHGKFNWKEGQPFSIIGFW